MNCNSAFLVHTDLGQSPRCSTCLALMFTWAYISTTPILRRLQSIGDNRTENSAAIIGTLTLYVCKIIDVHALLCIECV